MADGAGWYGGSVAYGYWIECLFEPCKSRGHRVTYGRMLESTMCPDGCLMVLDKAALSYSGV